MAALFTDDDKLAAALEAASAAGGDRLWRMPLVDEYRYALDSPVADLAHELWRRRHTILERYDELPQRLSHGDATPANLVSNGRVVTALDWSSCGLAPAGADLGYLSLSGREDLDVLVAAQMTAMPDGNVDDVRFAAQTMAVYTVMSQAEWALARAARGPGALAGKYRHPAVAPYLHALQRQFGSIEALLA